ncbi:hypothetical protein [Streptomyces tsukubensis]|uniref:Uncharacterized protein n=1 Tax=Streptomyces tsukubensis TaxID=83656 RepID=A0A1V4AAI4_9ACTN|nr:hypothetical protein [Streptomyces tsukubensis]OON80077.1 hypothetical protein B1H18_12940 [Streptomyces tsukubensis]QFR97308.1 hypothetical protein GBW32_34910 [Streptomyces tsukubensis]
MNAPRSGPVRVSGSLAAPHTGLPLDYQAFRQMTQRAYLRYARARTGDSATAERSVHAAFGELSKRWAEVLRSSCPAAVAWDILSRAVATHEDGRVDPRLQRGALLRLTGPQADAVLLHRQLRLTAAEAADLMGIRTSSLRALLRTAERALRVNPSLCDGSP